MSVIPYNVGYGSDDHQQIGLRARVLRSDLYAPSDPRSIVSVEVLAGEDTLGKRLWRRITGYNEDYRVAVAELARAIAGRAHPQGDLSSTIGLAGTCALCTAHKPHAIWWQGGMPARAWPGQLRVALSYDARLMLMLSIAEICSIHDLTGEEQWCPVATWLGETPARTYPSALAALAHAYYLLALDAEGQREEEGAQ